MAIGRDEKGNFFYWDGTEQVPISSEQAMEIRQQEAQQQMAQDTPALESFMIGAGKGTSDLVGGVADLYLGAREMFGDENAPLARELLAGERQSMAESYAPLQEERPFSSIAGQAVPYMGAGGYAAMRAAPAFLPQLFGQGLAGATVAGTSALGGPAERGTAAALEGSLALAGGTATAAVGSMMRRAITGIRGIGAGTRREAYLAAGGELSPGQMLDSPTLRRLEAPLDSAGMMEGAKANNQRVLQKQIGDALGDPVADLSEEGLGNSAQRISRQFTDAVADVDIPLDDALAKRVNQLKGDSPYVEFPDVRGNMSGKTYQDIRSKLAAMARTEAASATKTPGKLEYIDETIDSLDNAFMQNAGPESAAMLQEARTQWKVLKTLERGKAVTPDGTVNPASFKSAVNKNYGTGARRGRYGNTPTGKMLQGASDATSDMARVLQDSGTSARQGMSMKANLGAAGLAGGAGMLLAPEGQETEGALAGAILGPVMASQYGRAGNVFAGRMPGAELPGAVGAISLWDILNSE
jgi:hypothetical protein